MTTAIVERPDGFFILCCTLLVVGLIAAVAWLLRAG